MILIYVVLKSTPQPSCWSYGYHLYCSIINVLKFLSIPDCVGEFLVKFGGPDVSKVKKLRFNFKTFLYIFFYIDVNSRTNFKILNQLNFSLPSSTPSHLPYFFLQCEEKRTFGYNTSIAIPIVIVGLIIMIKLLLTYWLYKKVMLEITPSPPLFQV